jgi:WD40 repeat protein
VISGGVSTKLRLFQMNRKVTSKERASFMMLKKEFTGHQGVVTCSGFMSEEYLLSGGNDSTIFLWNYDNTRPLSRFDEH